MRGHWEEVTTYAGRKTVRQVLLEDTPGRANPEVRRKTVAKIIRGEKVLCKDYGSTAGDCQYDDLPVKKMIVRPDQIRIYV